MPYFANSPEAGIGRSDSKNPATTCKGITAAGRPCRRALGASAGNSLNGKGVLAILSHAAGLDDNPAAYYCWQHKDQAPTGSTIAQADDLVMNGRTSIDTLMGRLGVLDIHDETPTKPRKKRQDQMEGRPVKRTTLPQQWQEVPGPLLSVPTSSMPTSVQQTHPTAADPPRPVRRRNTQYHFHFFCCGPGSHDDDPPARPRPRPAMAQRPGQGQTANSAAGPSCHRPSQTALLKAWIPDHVAPATHSALMTELAKPLSQQDRDTGYIYMFWETPTDTPQPTNDLTRSLMHDMQDAWERRDDLLVDPWSTAAKLGRGAMLSTTDAIRVAAHSDRRTSVGNSGKQGPAARPGTMMLKIGRADNVQRRMDQWTRQCGRNITLLRYYPYASGRRASKASPSPSPRRGADPGSDSRHPGPVPNCARVERLIHVELAEQRVMKQCDACGRQHREWFEVDATRAGVQRVDDTIRRWIRWGEEKAKEDRL